MSKTVLLLTADIANPDFVRFSTELEALCGDTALVTQSTADVADVSIFAGILWFLDFDYVTDPHINRAREAVFPHLLNRKVTQVFSCRRVEMDNRQPLEMRAAEGIALVFTRMPTQLERLASWVAGLA